MSAPTRRSGILVPLFSAPASSSWGIGDIGDILPLAAWLADAGQGILQLLPINEMASGHQSPYSAMSAMAIDPIFIRVPDVQEFVDAGGEASLGEDDRAALDAARRAPRIAYTVVRRVKHQALCAAFTRFMEREWEPGSARAAMFRDYVHAEGWWLEEYALFRALHEREHGRSWTEWPEPLRQLDPAALAHAARELAPRVLFFEYLQWLAGTQWKAARDAANARGIALFGDLPFMVDTHSADVWTHQSQFDLDRSVGVPPDAFSATGQDWGMPAYDWSAIAADEFRWLRNRARRSAALFDGYRVDHVVGFYRTYSRPRGEKAEGGFSPAKPLTQRRLGERVLGIFREPGSEIIAEDLGTVPTFVRRSLGRLQVPGYKVLRWERDWAHEGHPFLDPGRYPGVSVAASGTHDTEPMVTWWQSAGADERAAIAAVPLVRTIAGDVNLLEAPYDPAVRDILLEVLIAASSGIVLLPIQDVFGWSDRINAPATVSGENWTYRLPWPIDRMGEHAEARERQHRLRAWATTHRRRP